VIHLVGKMNIILSAPTSPWTGIGKWFWRGIKWDQVS